jgi:preprotein translocase subunit YajC
MNKVLKTGLIAGLIIAVLVLAAGCTGLTGTATTNPTTGEVSSSGSSIWPMLIFLVVIFGLFYFVMIRPQRKRQKEQQAMIASMQKGDKVISIGGIYGTIESLDEESVVVKTEGGTLLRFARNAVNVRKSPTQPK